MDTIRGMLFVLALFGMVYLGFGFIINGLKDRSKEDVDYNWTLGLSIAAMVIVFGYFLGPHVK